MFAIYVAVRSTTDIILVLVVKCKDRGQKAQEERHWCLELMSLGSGSSSLTGGASEDQSPPGAATKLRCSEGLIRKPSLHHL